MDVLVKIKIDSPIEKTQLYVIQELKHHILTIIKTTMYFARNYIRFIDTTFWKMDSPQFECLSQDPFEKYI